MLSPMELQKYNPNKLPRIFGTRGQRKFQTKFLAVRLYHGQTGTPFDASIELVNGGGESEARLACECGMGCQFHTLRANGIINDYVLNQGHYPFPRDLTPNPLKSDQATIENLERERLGSAIADVIGKKAPEKKAK